MDDSDSDEPPPAPPAVAAGPWQPPATGAPGVCWAPVGDVAALHTGNVSADVERCALSVFCEPFAGCYGAVNAATGRFYARASASDLCCLDLDGRRGGVGRRNSELALLATAAGTDIVDSSGQNLSKPKIIALVAGLGVPAHAIVDDSHALVPDDRHTLGKRVCREYVKGIPVGKLSVRRVMNGASGDTFGVGFSAWNNMKQMAFSKSHWVADVAEDAPCFQVAESEDLIAFSWKQLKGLADATGLNWRRVCSDQRSNPVKSKVVAFLVAHRVPKDVLLDSKTDKSRWRLHPFNWSSRGLSSPRSRDLARRELTAGINSRRFGVARVDKKPLPGNGAANVSMTRNACQKRLIALLADEAVRARGERAWATGAERMAWHYDYCNPATAELRAKFPTSKAPISVAELCTVCGRLKTRFVFEHYEVVNEDGTITYYHRNLRCCGSCNLVAVNTCDKMGFARLPFEEAQPAARAFGMEALKFCFKSR
ncbi:hypothetical protein SO694_00023140 [Aureococcus anophagefferens]|uniref:Uncharacterized protein n=1 Tax=Aureococcus anophagefferens TaxID=44056 RepID=A0ABR1FTG8_AURAN